MELYYSEQRGRREERLQQKADEVVEWREPGKMTKTTNVSNNLPLTNRWFQSLPFLDRVDPPPPAYMGPVNSTGISRAIEAPKTPPSVRTASFRRRCMGSEPISPPNPLRLASIAATQGLPRPDTSPRFMRSTLPSLDCECIGDPSLLVFRVRLPEYLIHGPLDALVAAAELHANRLPHGWRTNLFSLTKCDIACKDIPGISSMIDPIVKYISLTMKFLYGCPKISMGYNQPHIVKYAAEIGHTGVQLHCDRCDITANLSLSKKSSYLGGGTYIAALNKLVKLEQGEILLHPGHIIHGGNPITGGTRYLLVAFADSEKRM